MTEQDKEFSFLIKNQLQVDLLREEIRKRGLVFKLKSTHPTIKQAIIEK